MSRLLALVFGLALLLGFTGCSTALTQHGTYVDAFGGIDNQGHDRSKGVTRARVMKQYGTPCATKIFSPALSVRQARKFGLLRSSQIGTRTFQEASEAPPNARIARVDEFRIRGPLVDTNRVVSGAFSEGLGWCTLGVSEVLLFPFAAYEYAVEVGETSQIYVFYDPDGFMLAETHPQKLNRKDSASSRLR